MNEIDQYDYELPRRLIAQHPLATRSDSRMLVVDRSTGRLQHSHVRDLLQFLNANDCIVVNDTRVVPARLEGTRTNTGGRWNGLFLDADDHGNWRILSQTRGKLNAGETVTLRDREGRDACRLLLLAKLDGGAWAAKPESDVPTFELLDLIGHVPLPPYIRDGHMVDADRKNYQTIYAAKPGAVAAPTAGLHFTKPLLESLHQRDVAIARVTLHVGLGTFRPVSVERLDDHKMHSEWGEISQEAADTIQSRRVSGGRVVAVGTTAVRVLETAAAGGTLAAWQGDTDLFIKPPYSFRSVDALLTNFHLPKSTLLVLVRTFGGDQLIQHAYQEAIREEYRFYSYGDAMLIL